MQDKSLIKARELVFRIINDSNIELIDKYELLLNLYNLLDPYTYEDSMKVLEKHRRKR